jgi:apolipoprotein D and lipocalin family protein
MGAEQSSGTVDKIDQRRQKTIKPFDPQRYSGKWYEIARYDNLIYERYCYGAIAEYEWNSNKEILGVKNTCIGPNNESIRESYGSATIRNQNEPGKLVIQFQDMGPVDTRGDYWVHWTDYDRYSIVGSPSGTYLWILSRYNRVPVTDLKFLLDKVCEFGYDDSQLTSRREFVDFGKEKSPA